MSVAKRPRLVPTLAMASSAILSSRLNGLLNGLYDTSVVSSLGSAGSQKVIGTHDGSFHCDEALAVSLLKLLPEYRGAQVVRTRNPDILSQCHVVVDVGAKYDESTLRFDHHQREFTGVLDGYGTRLSSAGLIYKHFGRDILREVLKTESGESASEEFVDICYHSMYKNFIEHIDAIDNGVPIADTPPKYFISTTLSARVGYLNPNWNEDQTPELANARFTEAMHLTCSEFVLRASALANSWWPARSIIQDAVDGRLQVHPSGKIIVLEKYCPWKEHLFEIESKASLDGSILYALYADQGGSWRIQAVPVDANSFHSRKKLPDEWRGLRDDALSQKSGIPGCIFVHAEGFIGGAKDKDGALQLAIKALDM